MNTQLAILLIYSQMPADLQAKVFDAITSDAHCVEKSLSPPMLLKCRSQMSTMYHILF